MIFRPTVPPGFIFLTVQFSSKRTYQQTKYFVFLGTWGPSTFFDYFLHLTPRAVDNKFGSLTEIPTPCPYPLPAFTMASLIIIIFILYCAVLFLKEIESVLVGYWAVILFVMLWHYTLFSPLWWPKYVIMIIKNINGHIPPLHSYLPAVPIFYQDSSDFWPSKPPKIGRPNFQEFQSVNIPVFTVAFKM